MKKILIIGKGNLFSSMVHSLSLKNVKESVIVVPYEEQDDLMRSPLLEQGKLQGLERIYLVPGTLEEGVFFTAQLSEKFNGSLFVVTEDYHSDFIYKKTGADYVIVSKPKWKSYTWFPLERGIL